MDDQKLEELLQEELTGVELRDLLERLGAEEFGGPENSRLRDVVELTGREPLEVARILADIRKEDWEERFGSILEDHGERIERLERQKADRSAPSFQPPKPDPDLARKYNWRTGVDAQYDDPYLQEARDRIEQEHQMRPIAVGLLALVGVVYVIVAANSCPASTVRAPGAYDDTPTIQIQDNGKWREATPGERAAFEAEGNRRGR